jgi:hypothetical protein
MAARQDETTRNGSVLERRMRGPRPAKSGTIVVIGVVLLVVGVLVGGILGHVAAPPVVTSAGTEHLYLSIAYDPYTGLDQYFPANFTVSANTPILITITNYDNGTNVVPAAFGQVLGTVGGTETVTNATASGVTLSSVPADAITHTFTIDSGSVHLNVPIPAAQDTTPTVVSFTVTFTSAGEFVWHCMAPCDMDAMTTPGFMTGTVTVVNP